MSVLVCLANLALCAAGLRHSLRMRSIAALFWLAMIFLCAYPMALDACLEAVGMEGIILDAFNDRADGAIPYFDGDILLRAGLFTLAFNALFWSALHLSRRGAAEFRDDGLKRRSEATALFWIFTAAGYAGLLYMVFVEYGGISRAILRPIFEYGWRDIAVSIKHRYLQNLASIFIVQSAFGIYYGLRFKRHSKAVVACGPNLAMAFITAQRPWLVALVGPVLAYSVYFGWFRNSPRNREKLGGLWRRGRRFALVVLALLAFIFFLNFVRAFRERPSGSALDDAVRAGKEASYLTGALRDHSIFIQYWVFEHVPQYLETTHGRSSRNILATILHLPQDVARSDLVGWYVAWHRNGQAMTTLHPTICGWSYCDLAWWGVLWGGMMGLVVGLVERLAKGDEFSLFAFSPVMALMLVVATRGSVEYAITRAWYAVLMTLVILVATRKVFGRASASAAPWPPPAQRTLLKGWRL